ncbi:hypothetical protein [Streptomyces sp. NPDC092903]|uniref:hypothetical protein n=1 Tax=Streptomyces sp. NPDC092903 TaxID=3366017 RepID=UPI003813A4CE
MYPHCAPSSPVGRTTRWRAALRRTALRVFNRFLDRLSTEQLLAAARHIDALCTERARVHLLELLRADSATLHSEGLTDCPAPVTQVRFTTSSDDYNPVCWDDNAVVLHTTGATTQVDYVDTPVESALRDYSSFTDPGDGARLVVNLTTGEFAVL